MIGCCFIILTHIYFIVIFICFSWCRLICFCFVCLFYFRKQSPSNLSQLFCMGKKTCLLYQAALWAITFKMCNEEEVHLVSFSSSTTCLLEISFTFKSLLFWAHCFHSNFRGSITPNKDSEGNVSNKAIKAEY